MRLLFNIFSNEDSNCFNNTCVYKFNCQGVRHRTGVIVEEKAPFSIALETCIRKEKTNRVVHNASIAIHYQNATTFSTSIRGGGFDFRK